MAEWWKSLSEVFTKGQDTRPLSLKERLEVEQRRMRETEERQRRTHSHEPQIRASGETDAQAKTQDCQALATLLGWKLDTKIEHLTENPANIDGYWFGVRRYLGPPTETGGDNEILWKLYLFRPCTHCKFLIYTLELGDYTEVKEAVTKMMTGERPHVPKATERLAAYLNEVGTGKFDPHMPRFCPACRKPIKGLLEPRF